MPRGPRRGSHLVLLLAALAGAAGGCRIASTSLARLVRSPQKYQGQEITVTGRVEAPRWMPQAGALGFRLVDGPDSVLVLTLDHPPAVGRPAHVRGRVVRRFPFGAETRLVLLTGPAADEGLTSGTVDMR